MGTMPMRLDEGWNQIQFNLSDFTRRAYGTNYIETLQIQLHANCRIRRIYFSDRLYSEEIASRVQALPSSAEESVRGNAFVNPLTQRWNSLALCTTLPVIIFLAWSSSFILATLVLSFEYCWGCGMSDKSHKGSQREPD